MRRLGRAEDKDAVSIVVNACEKVSSSNDLFSDGELSFDRVMGLAYDPFTSISEILFTRPKSIAFTRSGGRQKMDNKIINAFISHIQEEEGDIPRLKGMMARHGITARNYSITSDKFNNAKSEHYIKTQILGPQIKQSSVLITHVAPDTKDSKWVNWEIEHAHKEGKRIIGVWQRGARNCELPEALKRHADAIVGWNGESIIDAINGSSNDWYNQDGTHYGYRNIERHPC